jgi:hypothetical protein
MASRLQDIILRGTAALRPLSTAVAPGTLYFSTDTKVTERCSNDGSAWETFADVPAAVAAPLYKVTAIFDGGGVAPTAGSKVRVSIPVAGNIVRVRLLADVAGNAVVDISKSTYALYPTVASIVAAAKPTLAAVIKNEDVTLTGWTVAVLAGDTLVFNLDSASTLTWLNCELFIQP